MPKWERVTIATFMCVYIGSGSSVSRAGWQISYAAIAVRGRDGGGPRLCGRGDLFSVSESFFSPPFRKGRGLDRDKPLDLSGKN